jgi:hypothetical protein
MTELSPQAQAVLDAYRSIWLDEPLECDVECLAAALRSAADQVVPKDKYPSSDWTDKDEVRYQLLAIAAELEGADD